jgi:hypothetical protein
VRTDLDALLTELYVLIDDHVMPATPRHRGRPKQLTDAELVCLAVAQVLLGARSEHQWLRMCATRLRHLFPYLPQQPGYHKRLKAAAPLICRAMVYLASVCPSWADEIRLLDATPIPCGTSRTTAQRSELAGWANYGYCAAHSRWYWGLKLYLLTTRDGIPVTWCLADPKLGESEVTEDLLGHAHDIGALRPGLIILGDKGISTLALDTRLGEQYHVLMARPDRITAHHRRFGNLGGMRQWIEAIINTGKTQLTLEHHGGRTPAGVITRIAQRLLALTTAIWHNWKHNTPVKRSLIAYDH